jgi:hypothetical protein
LEHTADFDSQGHDGRLSFRKFVTSKEMLGLLASALDSSPNKISRLVVRPSLPQLRVLATIACASEQPLHHVILGQLTPWTGGHTPVVKAKIGQPRQSWTTVEREFEALVTRSNVSNLQDACRKLNISAGSARIHFPDLVKRLVQKGRALQAERSAAKWKERSDCVRNAFRILIEAEVYPSVPRLQKMTGIYFRDVLRRHKGLLDEEWKRADGTTHFRRKRIFRRSDD